MPNQWMYWIMRERSAIIRYGIAVVLCALTLLFTAGLDSVTERALFILPLATTVITSIFGGYGPAYLATVICGIGMTRLLQPTYHLYLTEEEVIRLGTFFVVAGGMGTLGGALRSALQSMRGAQLKAEEATKARDEFISIASHELRTPLTSLKLQMSFGTKQLEQGKLDPANTKEIFKRSGQGLERLSRMIDDMWDWSKLTHGKFSIETERADLSQIVADILQRFSLELSEKGIPLTSRLEPETFAQVDPFRLDQIVSNLITNAIKYGGKSPIHVEVTKAQSRVRISVVDNGPGISPKDQERLFDRFERASAPNTIRGMGLGLYITKQITELHHGRIWVESSPGQGAKFIVELPASRRLL
jgi:signal transduction histidine kinase